MRRDETLVVFSSFSSSSFSSVSPFLAFYSLPYPVLYPHLASLPFLSIPYHPFALFASFLSSFSSFSSLCSSLFYFRIAQTCLFPLFPCLDVNERRKGNETKISTTTERKGKIEKTSCVNDE